MSKKAILAGIICFALVFSLSLGVTSAKAQKCKTMKMSKTCEVSAKSCASQASSCCPSGSKADCASKCKKACAEAKMKQAALIKNVSSDIPQRVSSRMVVKGNYVCGKCGLKKVDVCQGFIKTDDGKLYPLVKNHHTTKMKGACNSKTFKIVTSVRKINGVKHLEVKSANII